METHELFYRSSISIVCLECSIFGMSAQLDTIDNFVFVYAQCSLNIIVHSIN